MIIKPTSLTITQLFTGANEQYVIPTYQRRYSWRQRQVWDLIDDIKLIEGGDTHLLGSIVCLTDDHNAELNRLELVDGQQRLTTIAILLHCIRQRLEKDGDTSTAADAERLLKAKPLKGEPIRKLALDSIDSTEFDQLCDGDTATEEFKNQHLVAAFKTAREWVGKQSSDDLRTFHHRLANQAVIIRLDVSKAKDAFKLFETINNRGLRLSSTDIIKNFLLGNAARFGPEALKLARDSWASLLVHLDGTNADAFFRYYLMTRVRTRVPASKVVLTFKQVFMATVTEAENLPERHLYPDTEEAEDDEVEDAPEDSGATLAVNIDQKVSFKDFLGRLVECARIYGQLVLGNTGDDRLDRHLRNLRMIKAVQTYGFLMYLRAGGCTDKIFRSVLQLTENFVLRRHVCRERANDTEALFARLCAVNPGDPVGAIKKEYRNLCPSDEKFQEEFASTSFTANLIDRARYCLGQIEAVAQGEYEELEVLGPDDVHVEHIIPQKIKTKKAREEYGDWPAYLGADAEARHPRYVSRIGNLTLFAGELNIKASNNPFKEKKRAYKKSSLAITKKIASMHSFRFKQIDARSKELAKTAVTIWPRP